MSVCLSVCLSFGVSVSLLRQRIWRLKYFILYCSVCVFQLRVSHVDDDVTFSCVMKFGDVIENCSLTLHVVCECMHDVIRYCVQYSTADLL